MQIPAARILQPPNHEDVLPRTVPRTALRAVPRTALRAGSRTVPQTEDRNYNLSTKLHTYGVSYSAGLRHPELIPTGTQTAFRHYETISWRDREGQIIACLCMRAQERTCVKWRALPPLFIVGARGRGLGEKTKRWLGYFPPKATKSGKGELHGGAPPWPGHTCVGPLVGGPTSPM